MKGILRTSLVKGAHSFNLCCQDECLPEKEIGISQTVVPISNFCMNFRILLECSRNILESVSIKFA